MRNRLLQSVIIISALALQGCATGYNRALVTNNSNIGLDLDTAPAKMETTISSQAGVMMPTFEGGQTVPVISSISATGNGFAKFFNGLSSTVSTGDAAYTISYLYSDCNRDVTPIKRFPDVKLTQAPNAVPGPGEVRPAIFMTDTMVGAKVLMGKHAAMHPSSLRFGFSRQEEVSTPIIVEPDQQVSDQYVAGVPSFMATIDHWLDLKNQAAAAGRDDGMQYLQYFAMGEAANNMALRSDVRQAMLKRITPYMTDDFCEDDYETRLIR